MLKHCELDLLTEFSEVSHYGEVCKLDLFYIITLLKILFRYRTLISRLHSLLIKSSTRQRQPMANTQYNV